MEFRSPNGLVYFTKQSRTKWNNLTEIFSYKMEHFLVHLIHCVEHPTICITSIATLAMSVSEISTQISFHVSDKRLNTAENYCYFGG